MAIRFYCHQCQARIKVPDGAQGKRVKCPRCGAPQRIPSESEPQRGDDAPPGAAPGPAPGASAAPLPAGLAVATAGGAGAADSSAGSSLPEEKTVTVGKSEADPERGSLMASAADEEITGHDADTVDAEQDDPLAALAAAAEARSSAPAPGSTLDSPPAFSALTRTVEPPTPIKPVITSLPRPQPQSVVAPQPLATATTAVRNLAPPVVAVTTTAAVDTGNPSEVPSTGSERSIGDSAAAVTVATQESRSSSSDSAAPAGAVPVAPTVPSSVAPPRPEAASGAGGSGIRPIKTPDAPRPIPLSSHPSTARPLAKPMPLSEHAPTAPRSGTLGPVPHYSGLLLAAWLLRGGAALLLVIVVFTLLFTLIRAGETLGAEVPVVVGGLLGGIVLFAFAEALRALRDIARNSFRK